jgi:prepilin-type N-terminal cleavage/methylation domain-containing protein
VKRNSLGFTLIEIAVVLVIIGLITAGILAMFTSALKSTKSRVAADNASIVQQALERFIERYGRLPCPAVPTATSNQPNYGVEDVAGCTTLPVPAVPNVMARGVVPWKTLGLPLEQVQDGYAHMFTYHVAIPATQLTAATVSSMRGNMTIHTNVPAALGLPPTGNQINSCMNILAPPPGGDDLNGCNMRAVVVLLSHGENGYGAYTSQGGQVTAPADLAEIENTDANVNFVNGEATASGFDDVLWAWAPDDLLDPLAQRGTIRSPAAVTQDQLRNAAIQVSNLIANKTSSCPAACSAPFPASPGGSSSVTIGGTTILLANDGWGTVSTPQPLLYTSGGGDICGSAPGTIAFTVSSIGVDRIAGPNPNTNRNDDLLVTVTVDQIKSQIITRWGVGTCS